MYTKTELLDIVVDEVAKRRNKIGRFIIKTVVDKSSTNPEEMIRSFIRMSLFRYMISDLYKDFTQSPELGEVLLAVDSFVTGSLKKYDTYMETHEQTHRTENKR